MSENITLQKLEENLTLFKKMYDVVRLVDPIEKSVIEYGDFKTKATNSVCHDYWNKGKICDNCISTRAHLDNKCFIKLEQVCDVIMMVTAIPVENSDRPLIVELLKNATDSMMMGNGDYTRGKMITNIVTEINDLIIRDELTHLYNRRYVDERLPADVVKSTLEDNPLSVIFMDVDNLKEINDNHGHAYGDKAIKEITNVIMQNIRIDTDWAARYGGDEIFICLNNTLATDAYQIAESIRSGIADIKIVSDTDLVKTTVSLGVFTLKGEALTANEIIAIADKRMYEAKRSGKNSTVGVNIYKD